MAFPFSNVAAPNKDSGFVSPPTTLGTVTNFDNVTQFWLIGANFSNGDQLQPAFVTLTDGAGGKILDAVAIPPKGVLPPPHWEFMPVVGLQWSVSGPGAASVTGKVWGYA